MTGKNYEVAATYRGFDIGKKDGGYSAFKEGEKVTSPIREFVDLVAADIDEAFPDSGSDCP